MGSNCSSPDISFAPSFLASGRCFRTWIPITYQFSKLSLFLRSFASTNVHLSSVFSKSVGMTLLFTLTLTVLLQKNTRLNNLNNAEEGKTDPFNDPTFSTQLIADNVSNMFRTSFANEKYAGPSINIVPASVSSSTINRPAECSNKLNTMQDSVYNVAHACNADPRSSSYPKQKFNPLPPVSNGAQTFKPSNFLSYSTKKEGYPLSHSCTSAQIC